MVYIPDSVLDHFIAEDVPYFDLTTHSLGIGDKEGIISYFSREEAVLCGTEEAQRIMEKLRLRVTVIRPSGTLIKPGEVFLEAQGRAQDLHMAWKVCQNLLDSCSGIATKARRMVDAVKSVNPRVSVVSTRKSFPGTKALCVKAILCGGAVPHRLGLSETVLIFKQHMNFMGGLESLIEKIPSIKEGMCEKKLIVEAESIEDGIALCRGGVDGLQFDKLAPEVLKEGAARIRELDAKIALLAAGGINESNAALYAASGMDALVTTSLFSAKPVDMGVKMVKAG